MVLTKPDFDVAIIGGGPAGSSMASYLAKAGVNCVVFERELFPRPHVGESLVPSSMRVFRDLGFLDQMEAAKFPKKFGAAWTAEDRGAYDMDFKGGFKDSDQMRPESHVDISFSERQQEGVDREYTYHVDRSKFDLMMLQHCNKLGASVYEGVKVNVVDFEAENPVVHFNMGRNSRDMGVSAKIVIDASGRNTFLGNQLKLKIKDPVFDQYAIHTWFDGYDRKVFAKKNEHRDFIFIHFLPISNTWIWQIPISESVTSIGVVTQKKNFAKARQDRENFFWEAVGSRPALREALGKADQMHAFKDEGDYSYAMKQVTGDRWLMIGDAGRFVDPIFSTGVSIAMNSSRFAHKNVLAALESGDYSRKTFADFERTIRLGTKNWYEFISVYYRLNVLFTYFVGDPRYRLDVLKLLQGDVYDDAAPPVLEKMKKMVSDVEQNEKHPWHKLLGDMTVDAFKQAAQV
ncbi:MAG: NAD(P)/FAD-dependent oxidoreductase [Candidatus Sulfotelmatobacter sp.]